MALYRASPNMDNSTTLITGKTRSFVDLDLAFMPKPGSPVDGVMKGDVYKKTDAAAVIQSVRNILLTNYNEKPFAPTFGGNIRSMLFETKENYSEGFMTKRINAAIEKYEKRAIVTSVKYFDDDGMRIRQGTQTVMEYIRNEIRIVVEFKLETDGEVYTASVNMNRLR